MKIVKPTLAIVIPCYDEHILIKSTIIRISKIINYLVEKDKISKNSFLYLVEDGSTDNTWNIIEEEYKKNKIIKGLKFAKNEGTQIALFAGYERAFFYGCDCAISIDADLQQDVSVIEEFINKYIYGADIVFGIRKDRKADNFIKKTTAGIYYKLMELLGVNMIPNHSDYRLVSKNAIQKLIQQKEKNIMLRIFFNSLNLKKNYVYYNITKNESRKSTFNFNKLFNLSINGLTSNTFLPLTIVYYTEIFLFFVTIFLILIFSLLLFSNFPWQLNYSGLIIILSLLCINFFCLSIISIYIKKAIREVKINKRYTIYKELN